MLLPLTGVAFLGIGVSGSLSRKNRWLMGMVLFGVLGLVSFQTACGGGSSTPATTGGTQAGTYTITLTGTSGSASHTTGVTLIVQ